MQKFALFTGAIVMALGIGAASSSAFAMGCLANQDTLVPMSLTHQDMVPNQGFGYDKNAYQAALAEGNNCSVTQQSQPVSDSTMIPATNTHAAAQYN